MILKRRVSYYGCSVNRYVLSLPLQLAGHAHGSRAHVACQKRRQPQQGALGPTPSAARVQARAQSPTWQPFVGLTPGLAEHCAESHHVQGHTSKALANNLKYSAVPKLQTHTRPSVSSSATPPLDYDIFNRVTNQSGSNHVSLWSRGLLCGRLLHERTELVSNELYTCHRRTPCSH